MAAVSTTGSRLFRGKNLQALLQGFAVKLLGVFAGLGLMAVLARVLTVSDLGRYILLLSVASFFGLMVQFGLGTASMRLIASAKAAGEHIKTRIIARKAVKLVGMISVAFTVVWLTGFGEFVLQYGQFPEVNRTTLFIMAAWVLLLGMQKVLVEIFRGFQKTTLAVLFDNTVFSVLLLGFATFVLIFSGRMELRLIMLAATLCMTISVVGALFLLHRQTGFLQKTKSKFRLPIIGLAVPILAIELAIFVHTQAEIWVVAAVLGPEDVGIYGLSMRIVLASMLPTVIVISVLAPKIVQLHERADKSEQQQMLSEGALLAAMPTLIFFVLVFLFGEQFLNLLFGPEFVNGYPVLVVLCAGRAINVLTGLCGPCLMLLGRQKLMMSISIIFAFGAIIPAVFAAKTVGIIGVAICFSAVMALQNIVQAIFVRRLLGVSTWVRLSVILPQRWSV